MKPTISGLTWLARDQVLITPAAAGFLPNTKKSLPSLDKAPSQSESTSSRAESDTSLTDEEKSVLNPPVGGTEEESRAHFDMVQKLAKEPDFLEIARCEARPVVTKVRKGATINVRNQDSVEHTIVIDADHTYTIPGGQTTAVVAEFGQEAGVYGYGCDTSTNAVGMFFVTE